MPAERFQQWQSENSLDASFLLKPHNVFYLAGYTSVCAGILVTHQESTFCTLWLDGPEARQYCRLPRLATYRFPEERLIDRMIHLYKKTDRPAQRIGIEKDHLQLRDYEKLVRAFPDAQLVDVTPAIDRMRAIKTEEEIANIRQAAAISDKAMTSALNAVRPGVTEIDVAAEAEYVMRKSGSGLPAFGTFVASGKRTLLAHPHASRKVIEPGEMVVIDLGATWNGYASDLCRTTFSSDPTLDQAARLKCIVQAQKAAASILKEGALCHQVYDQAHQVLEEARLAHLLPHDIGYGLGLRQSEFYPVIEKGSQTPLKQNMVVALFQTTAYDRRSEAPRVEDTFLITETGSERLTRHEQVVF